MIQIVILISRSQCWSCIPVPFSPSASLLNVKQFNVHFDQLEMKSAVNITYSNSFRVCKIITFPSVLYKVIFDPLSQSVCIILK